MDRIDGGSENRAAARTGVLQSTLHRIVHGRKGRPRAARQRIDPEILMKIARGYNVTTDWLLSGKGRGPLEQMSVDELKNLTDPIGIERAIERAEAEGDQKTLDGIKRNTRVMAELILNAGRTQWVSLLRQLQLSSRAFEAWELVPTKGIAGAHTTFVNWSAFDLQRNPLMYFNGRVGVGMHEASDGSFKAWCVLIVRLIEAFGQEAVRERMEDLVPEAWLGFNGIAIELAKVAWAKLGLVDEQPEMTSVARDWIRRRARLQPLISGLGEQDVIPEQRRTPPRSRGRPTRPKR